MELFDNPNFMDITHFLAGGFILDLIAVLFELLGAEV